jgi:hypothetical protein
MTSKQTVATRHPDAALIALGARFDALAARFWVEEANREEISEKMAPFVSTIVAARATSIEGLAVKARVAKHFAHYLYDEAVSDMDLDQRLLRHLIDATAGVAERKSAA